MIGTKLPTDTNEIIRLSDGKKSYKVFGKMQRNIL